MADCSILPEGVNFIGDRYAQIARHLNSGEGIENLGMGVNDVWADLAGNFFESCGQRDFLSEIYGTVGAG